MVDVSKAKELITSEDQGLQTTLERSSETLSSLAQVISEANATLLNAQDAQHRRHELALRRRTLLGEDIDGIAASTCSVSGDGEEGIGERRTAAEEERLPSWRSAPAPFGRPHPTEQRRGSSAR